MPEIHNNEFTPAAGLEYGDVFHIQRIVGDWTDFKVRNINMFGVDVKTKRMTFDIQDLLAGPQLYENLLPAGQIYFPIKSYAVYHPGTVNDGFDVQLLGQIGYESGGNKGLTARFLFSNQIQGAPLAASDEAFPIVGSNDWDYSFGGDATGTTSNGTITVWSAYSIVILP